MNSYGDIRGIPSQILGKLVRVTLVLGLLLFSRILSAQTYRTLYTFTGGADGSLPSWELVPYQGHLYGTATYGGTADGYLEGNGTVFEFDGGTHQLTVLHTFAGWPWDGAKPNGGLIRDAAANFYGTTSSGGSNNSGMVFQMNASGAIKPLHIFNGADGAGPRGSLVLDSAGNLYGATQDTVYKLDPAGTLTTLHTFIGSPDGDMPYGRLIVGNGFLFGTTHYGGSEICVPGGCGTVFAINISSGKTTILYSFTGQTDGSGPSASVVGDGQGNLYGTTSGGGSGNGGSGCGVVFELNIASRRETPLYTFPSDASQGYNPGGLVRDPEGNLYGVTDSGGLNGYGTIFKLDTTGNLATLYSFADESPSDLDSGGGLVRLSNGSLYGSTLGLSYVGGTIFQITP